MTLPSNFTTIPISNLNKICDKGRGEGCTPDYHSTALAQLQTHDARRACMQSWADAALLLVEQVRGEPHQEGRLRWKGSHSHACTEGGDTSGHSAASHQSAVR